MFEKVVNLAGKLTVHLSHDLKRVLVFEFLWEEEFGEVLQTNGSQPSLDGGGANARKSRVCCRWKRAAVLHRGRHFHAGWKSIEYDPACLCLER